jgi:DNA-binding transcriptional ArsR family regulator/ubiquinone/menaquinone biosynthesis C-methylase UbiE
MQAAVDKRWELYRILSEPVRLRLLAAAAQEELSIGELAELLDESQPNVSRHLAPLRKLGLLAERRQGTRVLVRLAEAFESDAVLADALIAGRALCKKDGTLERIAPLIKLRDAAAREFFARTPDAEAAQRTALPEEFAAYLMAVAPLIERRALAVDAGTGEGRLLEVIAPLFDRVIAIDREPAQLDRARERSRLRGFANVEVVRGDLRSETVRQLVTRDGLADAVFASRVLHHAPRPAEAMAQLASLTRDGGTVVILDYDAHDDETMREQQADVWLGFAPDELRRLSQAAGLRDARVVPIPAAFRGTGPDRHLSWQLFSARRAPRDAHG